jgi:tRNA-specific 2-thiouridylase
VRDAAGAARLAMGVDCAKDQSYFLYASPSSWLERLVFPLGESTKPEVRGEATARELPGHAKGESQELCFVGSGAHAYADFVAERAAGRVRPGVIVDAEGRAVGAHDGVHRFTIGQRKGIGVALGRPAFVTRLDPETGTVHLGDEGSLLAAGAEVDGVTLAAGVSLPTRARVRVRHRHEGDAASVEPVGGAGAARARVVFDRPVRAVTRGQIAVFYDADGRVLGGGRIASAAPLGLP